jgi:L-iditol 2-dehydrogenase
MKMNAAFLNKPKEIQLKKVAIPKTRAGEVRVKISKIGVCGSDVHQYLGHRQLDNPTIIGHEGLGYIDKIGDGVTNRTIGERVIIEPNIPCHKCIHCMSGKGYICIHKRVLGVNEMGCFAEYISLPSEFVWKVPDEISDEDAITIEPMAVGLHALLASKAKPGDAIAVIGLGAIGLLLTHLALSLGYVVYVTEINTAKLNMAENIGAIPVIATGDADEQAKTLNTIWEKNSVVSVFECAGSAFTASLVTAAAPRGSEIVLVGLSGNLATFKPLKIAREGITIVPSIIYDHPFDFKRTLQLIKAKIIRPGFIISRYMNLMDLQAALEIAAKGDDSKIVITVN